MSTPALDNRTFLEVLFAEMLPGAFTVICSFRGDPHKVGREAWAGRPWEPGQTLPPWFDGGNTYLTVSSFEPDPMSGECRRRKSNFVALHAVMVDDVGTKVHTTKLLLSPSALIETSPGNFQAFYFLHANGDTRDRGKCERLIERMIAADLTADGSDPGMKGVTRYGRLPVGNNAKANYVARLGRPFPTRCVSFEPARRYTIAEIAAAWRLDLSVLEPACAKVVSITPALLKRATESFSALLDLFRQMDMYLGQRGAWHDVMCPWVHEHTDRSTSGTALAEPSAENHYSGGFVCHHGHCDRRSMRDVRAWLRELVRLLDERSSR